MDVGDDITACLKYDDSKIRSLELTALKKIMPVFDQKHKTESKHLETLVKDKNQLRQTLGGLEIEKNQLEKLLKKKYQIYEELEIRGTKVQRELTNTKVMCPIYEFQMNQIFEEISNNDKPKNITSDEPTPPSTNWFELEENLMQRKNDLQAAVEENQEKIDKFVEKYLD